MGSVNFYLVVFGYSWIVTWSHPKGLRSWLHKFLLSCVNASLHGIMSLICLNWWHHPSVQWLWQNCTQCAKDLPRLQQIYAAFHSTSWLQMTPQLWWLKLPWGCSPCWTWPILGQAAGEAWHCLRYWSVNLNTFTHTWSPFHHTQIYCKGSSWTEWTSSCHLADCHGTIWPSAACIYWQSLCGWPNQFLQEWSGTSWAGMCVSHKFPARFKVLNTSCGKCGWNYHIEYFWELSKLGIFSHVPCNHLICTYINILFYWLIFSWIRPPGWIHFPWNVVWLLWITAQSIMMKISNKS